MDVFPLLGLKVFVHMNDFKIDPHERKNPRCTSSEGFINSRSPVWKDYV